MDYEYHKLVTSPFAPMPQPQSDMIPKKSEKIQTACEWAPTTFISKDTTAQAQSDQHANHYAPCKSSPLKSDLEYYDGDSKYLAYNRLKDDGKQNLLFGTVLLLESDAEAKKEKFRPAENDEKGNTTTVPVTVAEAAATFTDSLSSGLMEILKSKMQKKDAIFCQNDDPENAQNMVQNLSILKKYKFDLRETIPERYTYQNTNPQQQRGCFLDVRPENMSEMENLFYQKYQADEKVTREIQTLLGCAESIISEIREQFFADEKKLQCEHAAATKGVENEVKKFLDGLHADTLLLMDVNKKMEALIEIQDALTCLEKYKQDKMLHEHMDTFRKGLEEKFSECIAESDKVITRLSQSRRLQGFDFILSGVPKDHVCQNIEGLVIQNNDFVHRMRHLKLAFE